MPHNQGAGFCGPEKSRPESIPVSLSIEHPDLSGRKVRCTIEKRWIEDMTTMHDRSGKAGSANGLALFRGRIACTLALSLSFSIVFASSLSIAASEIYENSTPSSPSITPMTSLLDGQAASSTSADDHGITPITALETMSSDTPSPKTTADGAKPTTPWFL